MNNKIFEIFEEVDRSVAAFQKASGLHCVAGCGRCCENPGIETTPFELLPLAGHLFDVGQQDVWLDNIEKLKDQGQCVFYQPDPAVSGRGRCSHYSFRPAVCRLFGFSARINKRQQAELVTCPVIKENQPAEFQRALESVAAGVPVPLGSEYMSRLADVEPDIYKEYMPINKAIRAAIEREGLARRLGGGHAESD